MSLDAFIVDDVFCIYDVSRFLPRISATDGGTTSNADVFLAWFGVAPDNKAAHQQDCSEWKGKQNSNSYGRLV